MGFEKFGPKSFTSETKVVEFVDKLAAGEICATRCLKCKKAYFPPRADCPNCLGNSMEWEKIPEKGKLVSFTKLEYCPTGFEEDLPYTLALVDFGEVKVFGRLSKTLEEAEIGVGKEVKPVVLTRPDGQLTYEFVPA